MSLTYSSFFLLENGSVKSVGRNNYGQLGIGNIADQSTLQDVNITGIKQIACGIYHTFFLLEDGTVKSVGYNNYGQLGIGNIATQTVIQDVNITGVKQIVGGAYHTLFLLENGSVKSVGRNNYGQLGIGNTTDQTTPVDVDITGVKQIACGYYHTFFLLEDGTVKSVGYNNYGQLGIGNIASQSTPVDVNITGVKQIACGAYYTFFLLEDGTVKSVGYNNYGQLGIGNTATQTVIQDVNITGVKQIVGGVYHTLFLLEDGTAKSVGHNNYGQLGIGNITNQTTPVDVNITGVKQIACGYYHTFFLLEDGSVKSVGRNNYGQLGIENTTDQTTPVDVDITGVKSLWDWIVENIFADKYLFQDGEEIKTYINGWQIIGTAPATKEMFDTNGMEDLSIIDNEAIQTLSSDTPQLLCWTDETEASRTVNLTAIPHSQLLLPIEDIEVKELEKVTLSSSLVETGSLKVIISGDSGETWIGKTTVDITNLEAVKANGFTSDEFNALTTQELATFIPDGKARFAFYLEQEKLTDIIQVDSLVIGENIYTMTPSIENISVLYELLKYEQPSLFVSRDNGVTWKEVQPDALTNMSDLPEGTELKVKAILSNGQELYGLSYSWI